MTKICSNCVMDTTDSKIVFDSNGVCDWCNNYKNEIAPSWHPGEKGQKELEDLANEIKSRGKGKKYNCILGLSGGVDSSYVAYLAKEVMGLNPLCYVVDTGWNLNVADENIKTMVGALGLDVVTDKVDWDEMRDLQLAFFKSQVPYQDLPQDHVIFASLYNYAAKHGIKYVLSGGNIATECVRPPVEWVYFNDLKLIKDIQKKFGTKPLSKLPLCSMFKYKVIYEYLGGTKRVKPLNMVPYNKEEVQSFLEKQFGWKKYEEKHYENVFTRFYEGYYLPHKFGYDKRKCYLSTLILTSGLSRSDALKQLETSPYTDDLIEQDMQYISEKLGISKSEFVSLIEGQNKTYADYKNSYSSIKLGIKIARLLGIEKRNFR